MYYITNQTNEIIAADHDLLALVNAQDVSDLYKKVVLGEVVFNLHTSKDLILTADSEEIEYQVNQSKLSSILGELTVVHITKSNISESQEFEKEDTSEPLLKTKESEEDEMFGLIEDHTETLMEQKEEKVPKSISEEIDLDNLLTDTQEETTEEEEALLSIGTDLSEELPQTEETEDSLYNLILPSETSERIEEISESTEQPEEETAAVAEEDNSPIVIDIIKVSQSIGITPDDYNTFLNEYIDTAINLEKDLQSIEKEKKEYAIQTLSHLSNVLHLPKVNDIMDAIASSDEENQQEHIATLYATLSRLTTLQAKKDEPLISLETEEISPAKADEPSVSHAASLNEEGFGNIDLSDVAPIHFDFQLEEAANDLSLPVELIEEFVHDFIAQAKVETPKMLEAYRKGKLETIQKIGHLLKGAASNLRITPLADTLYDIQFCNDATELEPLIKNYWAHFLSFENQMNIISK